MLMLSLPVPPSVNNAWANRRGKGRGRVKTAAYRKWQRQADAYYALQFLQHSIPIKEPYEVCIVIPKNVKGDVDNRSKLLIDWMVTRKLIADDRFMHKLTVERDAELAKLCWISVRPVL